MQQKFGIHCHRHPQNLINVFINIKPDRPGPRFNCEKCYDDLMKNGSVYPDFILAQDLMQTLKPILNSEHYKDNLYRKNLSFYDEIFEHNINEFIDQMKIKWCDQLEQLRKSLKPQIELHTKLLEKFREYQESWLKIVGYNDFTKEYNQVILMNEKDSQSQEWKHLEQKFETMLKQINMKQNDEIQVMQETLGQQMQQLANCKELSWLQMFKDLQSTNQDLERSITKSLTGQFLSSTQLCPPSFWPKLQAKLNNSVREAQLLYKLGTDPQTAAAVWQKVNGRANTLMLIGTDTNQIIGAYTPAIWNSQVSNYIPDNTLQTFLFSVSKSEIYPLYQNSQYAIYNDTSYLPSFGYGSTDLLMQQNFTMQSTAFGNSYKTSDYNIVDKTTHLLNAKQANIKQFEIYQLILL